MRETVLGALALIALATSLGLAQVQLLGPSMPLLQPYRPRLSERVGIIDVATAWQLHREGEALFVDARESERYAAGHVPGAINLSADGDVRILPYGGALVIYCDGPECGAAARLAERVAGVRSGRTLVMLEGWPAWQRAGYPMLP